MSAARALRCSAALAVVGTLLGAAPLEARQSTLDFTVSGSSTVRNWTCTAQGRLTVVAATGGAAAPGFPGGVQRATVTVPIAAFKCPNDEMTQHLSEAMHADKFPEIVYQMDKYTVTGSQAETAGTLTITGVSKPVTVPLTLTPSDAGVAVEGATRLEFASFNLEPPAVFLGMLKVGPQIRLTFKGVLPK